MHIKGSKNETGVAGTTYQKEGRGNPARVAERHRQLSLSNERIFSEGKRLVAARGPMIEGEGEMEGKRNCIERRAKFCPF